ncbi:MAG: TerC family protein [Verrucomicrobiota bacterium]
MHSTLWFWAFNAGVLFLLALDLLVFHRKARSVTLREAVGWSLLWVCLSLAFNGVVWHLKGETKALEFLTGYCIEYALSMDNIFVFSVIFSYFRVHPSNQHRVLFWGILGAIFLRGIMITLGVQVVTRFSWTLYIFGAFLLVTGIKMIFDTEEIVDLEKNLVLKLCRRWMRVTPDYHGSKFFLRHHGVSMITPLALVLILIEMMDLVFAVDSIPAVFSVTRDPFIVYTSNICAILGLRSMYFLLAHCVDRFTYLKYGLAAVLSFIGAKMLLVHFIEIPIGLSLAIVAGCLLSSVLGSLLLTKPAQNE